MRGQGMNNSRICQSRFQCGEIFNGCDVNELAILVFAQFFGRNTRVLFNFFDEMILVGEILFRKKFAFADVFERSPEAKDIAIGFERNAKLLVKVAIDLLATPKDSFQESSFTVMEPLMTNK